MTLLPSRDMLNSKEGIMSDRKDASHNAGRGAMVKAAVMALSLPLSSVSIVGAIVGNLKEDFPDASTLQLQSFITIPVIGGIIATLVGGYLAARVGKKNLCLVGALLCFLGGIAPMFIDDLSWKTAVRVICGFGVGLLQPLSASLIVDLFKGKTADFLMGLQSSMVGVGAFILSTSIAFIMTIDWHGVYYVYVLALLVFAMVLAFVPNEVNEIGRIHKGELGSRTRRKKMPMSAYFGMVLQIVFAAGYGIIAANQALAAKETGVISAVQVATIISIASVSSLIGGLVFGIMRGLLHSTIGYVALFLQMAGALLTANTSSYAMWAIGACLYGIGFCWFMPYVNFLVNEHTDATISAQATSYAFFGNSIGSFITPYVLAAVAAVTGISSPWKSYNIMAVIMGVCMVMIFVFSLLDRKTERSATPAAIEESISEPVGA